MEVEVDRGVELEVKVEVGVATYGCTSNCL